MLAAKKKEDCAGVTWSEGARPTSLREGVKKAPAASFYGSLSDSNRNLRIEISQLYDRKLIHTDLVALR